MTLQRSFVFIFFLLSMTMVFRLYTHKQYFIYRQFPMSFHAYNERFYSFRHTHCVLRYSIHFFNIFFSLSVFFYRVDFSFYISRLYCRNRRVVANIQPFLLRKKLAWKQFDNSWSWESKRIKVHVVIAVLKMKEGTRRKKKK